MKQMDLLDRIDTVRFLGREFLVFVWWKSELFEGELEVEGFGKVNLHLDTSLVLECKKDELEKSTMRGPSPSATKEAKEALRAGKLPSKAHIHVVHEEQEFAFTFNADTMATAGVKIPALLTEEDDEKFFERMHLVEKLEALLGSLYEEFLRIRLSPEWANAIAPGLRAWVKEEERLDARGYEAIRKRVVGRK